MASEHSASALAIRPVTTADWPAFASLFTAPGAPRHCWCMAWRATDEERRRFTAARGLPADRSMPRQGSIIRRDAMRERIAAGVPVGLLAFHGEAAVGWCSVAPRPTFRTLGGPKDHASNPSAVWSIACFYIARPCRRTGLVPRLIAAALDYARQNGAGFVEAYPVAVDARRFRFMGLVPAFAALGFTPVADASNKRTVMRRAT